MILLVSAPADDHSARVAGGLRELGARVDVVDFGSISSAASVELEFGAGRSSLRLQVDLPEGRRSLDLSRMRAGWWRRDDAPVLSRVGSDLDGADIDTTDALEGVLEALDIAWLTAPAADRSSRRRPLVWAAAHLSGLPLPATVVTRDPAVAHRFAIGHLRSGIMAKSLVREAGTWGGSVPVAGVCALDELIDGSRRELVLQQRLPGRDVRVMITADTAHAVELGPRPPELPLDAQLAADPGLARPVELPDALATQLRTVLGRLQLGFATFELRRTPDGGYFFLDLDTAAPWLPIEQATGQPITAAVVAGIAARAGAPLAAARRGH